MSADAPITLGPTLATTRAEHAARTAHDDPPPPGGGTAEHGEPVETERDWRDDAACRPAALGIPAADAVELMHPVDQEGVAAAQAICRTCPVQEDCAQHALDHNEPHGVWGGMSERSRRRHRQRRNLGGVA